MKTSPQVRDGIAVGSSTHLDARAKVPSSNCEHNNWSAAQSGRAELGKGSPKGSTGSVSNPSQYAGQCTDSESGLQYLRTRFYDPNTQ
jgi:hypothetical protein